MADTTTEISPEVTSEIAALHAKLGDLENRLSGRRRPLDLADWKQRLGEGQMRKFLEGRERARVGGDAREAALASTSKERAALEARLKKIGSDRAARMTQHDRAGARIREDFRVLERAVEAELGELRDLVEGQVKAATSSPVTVTMPPPRMPGVDHTDTAIPPHSGFAQMGV